MKYPNINAEMARNGLNRQKLAEEMGVSRKTIYNWLTKGNIPLAVMTRLAERFGTSVDYLMGRGK